MYIRMCITFKPAGAAFLTRQGHECMIVHMCIWAFECTLVGRHPPAYACISVCKRNVRSAWLPFLAELHDPYGGGKKRNEKKWKGMTIHLTSENSSALYTEHAIHTLFKNIYVYFFFYSYQGANNGSLGALFSPRRILHQAKNRMREDMNFFLVQYCFPYTDNL